MLTIPEEILIKIPEIVVPPPLPKYNEKCDGCLDKSRTIQHVSGIMEMVAATVNKLSGLVSEQHKLYGEILPKLGKVVENQEEQSKRVEVIEKLITEGKGGFKAIEYGGKIIWVFLGIIGSIISALLGKHLLK